MSADPLTTRMSQVGWGETPPATLGLHAAVVSLLGLELHGERLTGRPGGRLYRNSHSVVGFIPSQRVDPGLVFLRITRHVTA